MKNLFTVAFLFCIISGLFAQEKSLVRIAQPTDEDYKMFSSQHYDIALYRPGICLDVVIADFQINDLMAQGYSITVIQTEKEMKDNLKELTDLAGYRSYNDLLTELQNIQAAYPAICKLYDIGDSRGKEYTAPAYNSYKHDIWALKLSDNVAIEEDEPCVYYMGEHHAREPISLEVAMYVLNYLVANYGTDPNVTYYVDNTQIWFVPLVNPNGHKIVFDEVDLWWRKNIRDNNNSNTINTGTTDGVDLNRNYSWEWGGAGTSHTSSDITYCGPSAFSEPETMAMKNLLDSHHFVAGISYHSYSELVLYPFGYAQGMTPPDNAAISQLATNMANTIPRESSGYYTPQPSWQLYSASGVTDDYAYGEHGIFAYCIELGVEFIPPASNVLPICQKNLTAALMLLNRVNQSTVTGIVKDANTNLPVVAEVYVNGVDNTGQYRKPYTSNETFGRYYRMLVNGNYTITFSAYGYIPQTFNNVNINSNGQTILNVNLVPAQSVVVSGIVTDLDTGLPIEGATIEILNTPVSPVTTNALGEYSIPGVMEGNYNFRVSKINYATIIQSKNVTVSNYVFDFQLQESTAWSFETGVYEPQWTFGGNAPWYITNTGAYDGTYCSRSGAIGHSANSDMMITLTFTSAGTISFYRKVSSEASYDFLTFYIDGVQQGQWSGEVAWGLVSYPVTSGTHTMKWSYTKDVSVVSGSDCAWVDFIEFPPYVILAPEISTNPDMFSKTLSPGGTANDVLNIANTGNIPLDFSAQVVYSGDGKSSITVYPQNLDYRTGTCTSSAKTEVSLVKGYPTTQAGWMTFDVSGIPDGAIINSVEFHGYVNATYYPYWNINPVTSNPLTASAATLYADIIAESSSGYYLYRSESSSYSTGWKVHTLGGNVNTDLQNALAQDWFAIGIMDRDASSTYYIGFDGWAQTNKPYLVIDYTYVPTFTWLKINGGTAVNGSVAAGSNQNINVSFDAGSYPVGTYNANIKITSNDADEGTIFIPCTMVIASGFNLNLTAMLEGPFNGINMNTMINGIIPLNQPYNTTPWNYNGTESVASIPANVVDWVLVELRDATSPANATPATRIVRQAGFMMGDGSIVATDGVSPMIFSTAVTNGLYVVLHHRGHLSVMSASALVPVGQVYSHNFSTEQAYGTSAQCLLAPGVYGLRGGDANGDGEISTADMLVIWSMEAGTAGYLMGDFNLDGQVDNKDKDDCWVPNYGLGCQVPE